MWKSSTPLRSHTTNCTKPTFEQVSMSAMRVRPVQRGCANVHAPTLRLCPLANKPPKSYWERVLPNTASTLSRLGMHTMHIGPIQRARGHATYYEASLVTFASRQRQTPFGETSENNSASEYSDEAGLARIWMHVVHVGSIQKAQGHAT